ncbi:hypothetical protein, partial [Roseisalinus antarcticus]|uniref:hypothetical protein n=1 Tax=Roseisalinus antarcticus TaxID=254357 RepID=UPI0013563966
ADDFLFTALSRGERDVITGFQVNVDEVLLDMSPRDISLTAKGGGTEAVIDGHIIFLQGIAPADVEDDFRFV